MRGRGRLVMERGAVQRRPNPFLASALLYPGNFTYPNAYPNDAEYTQIHPVCRNEHTENKSISGISFASGAKGRWFESTRAYQSSFLALLKIRSNGFLYVGVHCAVRKHDSEQFGLSAGFCLVISAKFLCGMCTQRCCWNSLKPGRNGSSRTRLYSTWRPTAGKTAGKRPEAPARSKTQGLQPPRKNRQTAGPSQRCSCRDSSVLPASKPGERFHQRAKRPY